MSSSAAAHPLRFGRFELQPRERRLLVDGAPAALGARAFDVLLALAERPGRLVSKSALMDLVWPGLVVQENNLAAQVSALRKVVGDAVIATIPGRGYRFVAPVEPVAQARGSVPAAQTPPPALRTNLPVDLPALLGRAYELDALGALIDGHRAVSLVGAGGIGKSLLAQHLLHARRGAYPQGVCWVELASVTEADALPGAVATALGVEVAHGEPLAALVAAVAPLTLLLALDNAEHLIDPVARLVRALRDATQGLRIVVTSQAPLKLAAERVFRIGPLAVPAAVPPAAQALQFGAVALFAERAHAIDGRFALAESNAGAVIEICRALDGHPLAIELAAARAPTLGVQPLLASMQDRLRLLTSNRDRTAPERQQTLRAALEWSHALLSPREQTVFRRLGVIAGSGSLTLIQSVVADDTEGGDLDRWAVLDALDTLVDRSLVAVLSTEGDGEPRYRLLESPRAYALERIDAAGERAALQRRHAYAVAAMFDAAYADYFSGRVGVDEWMQRREFDFDNARDALQWARNAGEADVELRIGATLLRALPPSMHAERMALASACEARLDPALPEPLQFQVWIEVSCALADTYKQRARQAAESALRLARTLDGAQPDRFALFHALARCASAAAQADDLPAARALLDELRALEDPAWPAHRLLWGAEADQWVARIAGDTAAALDRGRRLVALDRERGSLTGRYAAISTGNLIDAELAAGDAQGAARSGAALVEWLRGTRHEYALAFASINLMAALLAMDDCAQARTIAQQAWEKAPVFDVQHAAAAYLALLAALEHRPHAAAQLVGYSEAIYTTRDEVREANETAATQRARALAAAALGDATFERLRTEGARLRDAEIAAIAFATT
ncbi:MAG: helix-turn-helix transcriptional regulator [Burkholderiaceae bacterium]|jgi:predicted ATPase/DNA-binding winged helix-turn-helix (wHTH) protein|nr:helix-turn-helix transcriptional regulator [Burkholderiaceae bacterium]